MNSKLADLLDRSIWTFAQAAIGSLVAANVFSSASVDWRSVLTAAAVAGGFAVLKVMGVNTSAAQILASVLPSAPAEPISPAPAAPVPAPVVTPSTGTMTPVNVVVPEPAPAPDLSDGANPVSKVL